MKQPVIRQVKSLHVGCDKVGNLLLAKFSCIGAADVSVILSASTVFWLLRHLPANRNPDLQPPPAGPVLLEHEWDDVHTPRVLSVQGKQMANSLRLLLELNRKTDLSLLLDASNVELLRSMLAVYQNDLIDLDAA